jgi:hydroxymethylglutaryl-CoA synthase
VTVGIETIEGYTGRLQLALPLLAEARGLAPTFASTRLMADARTVLPPWEDAVTLAVNAGRRLLDGVDPSEVALLIVATESGVDFGKPISSWVHRYLGLPAACRNFEVKHACYGGTAALHMAAAWVASGFAPGKKALVIASDHSRSHLGSEVEFISGAGAVAMLMSATPGVLALELGHSGYWSTEIADTFRPTATAEMGDSQMSLYSYLDALEEAYGLYEACQAPLDPRAHFQHQIYHAPFPGMPLQGHRALLRRHDVPKAEIQADFEARVAPSLWLARQVGGTYSASVYLNLLGLLSAESNAKAGDRVGFFSYGSGCQAEFFSGTLGEEAAVRKAGWPARLAERVPLTVEQYEALERAREGLLGLPHGEARDGSQQTLYDDAYAGRGLLVLDRLEDHRRHYGWS